MEPENTLRPLIVVTTTLAAGGTHNLPAVKLNVQYVTAVEEPGGTAVLLTPGHDAESVERLVGIAHGLVLTGGEDVDPALYGAAPHARCDEPDPLRDRGEIALVRRAAELRMPLLAICRGIQVLNVAFGGTLHQDIPTDCPSDTAHRPGGARDARCHDVTVADGSRLAAALGAVRLGVNRLHHQAPALAARSLRVVATAPDGVIEGREPADPSWWAVAVQWHPEELTGGDEPWDRGLFAALVRRAAGRDTG